MSQVTDNSDALLAAIDSGRMLPSNWYTDPLVTERELQQIFRKSWAYVGPVNELKTVGDYITGSIGGRIPVAVTRGADGLNGLVNICRHRRHEVLKGRGNTKALRCGYHGWTYDLAGGLQGAPRTAGEPGFRLEDYPLLPLRVETLGPWVFVNADHGALPVRQQYGKLLDIIAQSGVDLECPRASFSRGVGGARKLENDAGKLSRVLSLCDCPSRVQRGDRRFTGQL